MLHKKVLLLTYHFPPSAASGAFRMLGFARHLPAFGWQPLVVAPPTLPWEPIDPALADDIPETAIVAHVPYPAKAPKLLRFLAPNALWLPRALLRSMRVIREHGPEVIVTSGPPHCLHALGHYLKRLTGLPWIADFRDPWISDGQKRRWSWSRWRQRRWERCVFENADLILANTPNGQQLYQVAYPASADKIVTLTNGFDPRDLAAFERSEEEHGQATASTWDQARTWRPLVRLLHAGEIYAGRNPLPLFEALARLNADEGQLFQLGIMGRCETPLVNLLRERGWHDFVALDGQRPYRESLDAMDAADILVLFDAPGRTVGVPAKLYEYFGAGRPILALAEPDGDVAAILRASGVLHRVVSPTNPALIEQAVRELARALPDVAVSPNAAALEPFTRAATARALAGHLDRLIGASSDDVARWENAMEWREPSAAAPPAFSRQGKQAKARLEETEARS